MPISRASYHIRISLLFPPVFRDWFCVSLLWYRHLIALCFSFSIGNLYLFLFCALRWFEGPFFGFLFNLAFWIWFLGFDLIEVSSRKVFSGSWVFGFEYFHIGKCFVVDLHVLLVSLGICLYIYIYISYADCVVWCSKCTILLLSFVEINSRFLCFWRSRQILFFFPSFSLINWFL